MYKLHQVQQRFMCKLVSCFIKVSIIQEHKEERESYFALSVLPYNHNDDIDLGIGIMTRNLLKNSLNEGNITKGTLTNFTMLFKLFYNDLQQLCQMVAT